jgi:Na+/H+ antiporter NhaD/arsenite permease-like protein
MYFCPIKSKKQVLTTLLLLIFLFGYLAITLENALHINKAGVALLTGVACWTTFILFQPDKALVSHQLMEHLGEIAAILFFLLGAMTIVELIDAHDGFYIITERVKTSNARHLLWMIALISFSLSAVLDNLTTTIVMVSMLRKLIEDREKRLFFAGIVVIAANAGGAWSPIGDVTTTMLWIGNQITATNIIQQLFLPSLVCLLVPVIYTTWQIKGNIVAPQKEQTTLTTTDTERKIVFTLGLSILFLVPIFKSITHLPPFMAILLGLGVMWILTELIHKGKSSEDKDFLTVTYALRKIDTPSILFFLGILLSIAVLQVSGILENTATWLTQNIKNESILVLSIGLLSAVIDNVPLVAAAQGMFSLGQYPTDHPFWEFLAYTTGTGGSILIIGSAAGVAAMGLERIDFFWYLRRISWLALLGYFAGALVFLI